MVIAIPVWYLEPPFMVPIASLPPHTEPLPMQSMVQTPPPPVGGTDINKGGKNENVATPQTRVQPPCSFCTTLGHPTNILPTLHELCNLIQLPKSTALPPTPLVAAPTTAEISSSRKEVQRTNFTCAICSKYGHYIHHCLSLPQFWETLASM
jgi:hypothetical protein